MKLCLNCLRNNHATSACRNTTKCRYCNKKHNSLLHIENTNQSTAIENQEQGDSALTLNNHSLSKSQVNNTVVLATAILVKNSKGRYQLCRLFLDPGSMLNCITKNMFLKLGLKSLTENFEIRGLNGTVSSATQSVLINVKSSYNDYTLNKITEHLPLTSLNPSTLEIPTNVQLADPKFYESGELDLLLRSLLCIGQINLPTGLLLQKNHFGFIAGGLYNNRNNQNRPVIARLAIWL
jgi:hypothetical protein